MNTGANTVGPLARLKYYFSVARHRIFEQPLWRAHNRRFFRPLSDAELIARFGLDERAASVPDLVRVFSDRLQQRFFFHASDRTALLDCLGHRVRTFAAEAEDYRHNYVDLLGSGRVPLGEKINWHQDFKSGRVWPLQYYAEIDYVNWNEPSDVKVAWELSRFHGLVWLGKAYWSTGEECYARKFAGLVADWITENPFAHGVNWACAMEVAIRASNWIFAALFFCESPSISPEFWMNFYRSLYHHGEFVRYNLELGRVGGNHYIADGYGLVVLGILFRSTAAGRRWLRLGCRILEDEIRAEVHSDGVNYEKSVSYHRLVLEFFYTAYILGQRNGIAFSAAFADRLEKMFEFTLHYTKPNGMAPLISDADNGRLFRFSPLNDFNDHRHALGVGAALFDRDDFRACSGAEHEDVIWLLGARAFKSVRNTTHCFPKLSSKAFPEGGYYVLRGDDAHVIVDTGDLGAEGLGGHGHNDTLSFELYWGGDTFITDSGTYAYTSDAGAYLAFSSTQAHNTVMVDGEEVADYLRVWRVVKDLTRPKVLRWYAGSERDELEAEHYGYMRLAAPVVHRRKIVFEKEAGCWLIEDQLFGEGEHDWALFFHVAPSIDVRLQTSRRAVLRGRLRALTLDCNVDFRLTEGWVAPTYGVRLPAKILQASIRSAVPATFVTRVCTELLVCDDVSRVQHTDQLSRRRSAVKQ